MKINRKKIWSLSWPIILANLTIPLIGITDTMIMGHMPSSLYIASIALGSIIFNFLYAGLNFLRMGTTGIISQQFGKKDFNEVLLSFFRALIIAIVIGIIFIVFKESILNLAIYVFNPSEEIKPLLKIYFFTRVVGLLAGLINMVFLGWFFGMQKTKSVMLQLVCINSMNIILSIYFCIILKYGIFGVALGSVIGQFSGLALSIFIFLKHYDYFNSTNIIFKNINSLSPVLDLFNISKDLFIRTMFLISAQALLIKKATIIGINELATIKIMIVIFSISSYSLDAFAHTAETTVGNAVGSKNKVMLKDSIRFSSELSVLFAILIGLFLYLFKDHIITAFTDIESLIALTSSLWNFVIITPIIAVMAFQLDGIFIGATLAKQMRNSMILSSIIFYISIEIFDQQSLTIDKLYLCYLLFLFLRGIILSLYINNVFNLTRTKFNYGN